MSELSGDAALPSPGRTGPIEAFRAQLARVIEDNDHLREQFSEFRDTLFGAVTTHRSGKVDEAESQYRAVLTKIPNHPHALHMLGVIELQRGNVRPAIDLIRRATEVHPGRAEPWVNLGSALHLINETSEAIRAFQRAIAITPGLIVAYTELSRVLADIGHYEAAVSYCEGAVSADPQAIPARVLLALALRRAGRLPEAARQWSDILTRAPKRAESYYVLGAQFRDMGQLAEALRCQAIALSLKPDMPEFLCAKGTTLIYLNRAKEALACFERANAVRPGFQDAMSGMGWALRSLGRFGEADQYFQKVRDIDPADPRSYKHLSSEGNPSGENDEQHLTALLNRTDISTDARITVGFGLGRLLDKAGRYDDAFARYAEANVLVRSVWPPATDHFDVGEFAERIDRLIARHQDAASIAVSEVSNLTELPVFVVGMPRSGTTLVEQICAAHSRVFGAGELGDLIRFNNVLKRPDIAGSPEHAREVERSFAKEHIVKLYGQSGGAARVVDKMPDNILLVGLIARLFPRARFIWCSRDNRDIALSCFFQMFAPGAQHFSYDLADCGNRTRLITRLARHWLRTPGLRMMEMNYETLVSDLEGQSRRLIEFLGLDWEPGCLDFHRVERSVATVSYWQVRQPLYQSSVGRWRTYERHLGPLFAALENG